MRGHLDAAASEQVFQRSPRFHQVALNGAAQPGDRVAVIGLIEVFYDEIFPALAWKPF
jgi:hypothetical protein